MKVDSGALAADEQAVAMGSTSRDSAQGMAGSGLRWPLFAAACVFAGLLYWPTIAPVLHRWQDDPTYSHGFLIAVVSAWMIWRTWRRGELEHAQPAAWALAPLFLAGFVWLLAQAASIQLIQQLMLPAMLWSFAWVVFGWRGAWALLVPIGILYSVLPAWDYVRPPLQGLTVSAVGGMLGWLDIPAFIQGYRVDLPGGSFEIVEGCSGLHFFMAAVALSVIQGYLYLGRGWARAALISAALGVALVANWIRVLAVVVAGHLTEMEHFLIRDHYYFGWVVFAVMMVPVLLLGRRLEASAPARAPDLARPPVISSGTYGMRTTVLGALLALAAPALVWSTISASAVPPPGSPVLPAEIGAWQSAGAPADDWRPLQPGASLESGVRYTTGRSDIDAWLFYYPRQTMDRKLIGYGNHMARPEDGLLESSDMRPGELRLVAHGGDHGRLIRYRYEVAGRTTTSPMRAKLYQVLGNLGARPTASIVALSARCGEAECVDARQALDEFQSGFPGKLPWGGMNDVLD